MDLSRLWQWKGASLRRFNLLHWAPIIGSAALMIMVALVSVRVLSQLKGATASRQRAVHLIPAAESFRYNLQDLQRGARGFAWSGDTNALEAYQAAVKLEPLQFNQLVELTGDTPQQQERLKQLAAAVRLVASNYNQAVLLRLEQGTNAFRPGGPVNEARSSFNQALGILKSFTQAEAEVLDEREKAEQAASRKAERLLVVGCSLAALLLLFANVVANHELNFRRRTEEQLERSLMLQNAVFKSAEYAIVTADLNGIVQTINPAAERLLGWSARELVGQVSVMLWRDPKEIAERAVQLSQRLGHPIRPTFDVIAAKVQFDQIDEGEWTFVRRDGTRFVCSLVVTAITDPAGNFTGYTGIFRDISQRKSLEAEREKLIIELRDALAQIKTLSGLIPICSWCKSVRNDTGYWQTVEQYVRTHSEATFTHGICPDCQKKFEADIERAAGGKPAAEAQRAAD